MLMFLATLLAQNTTKLGGFQPPSDLYSQGSGEDKVTAIQNAEGLISSLIGVITLIAGLFFIFYFVMGGLNWVTAGGDKGKVDKARDQMVQGVIGMIVIVISYGLIGVIGGFLGLDLLHPGQVLLDQILK